MKFANVIVDISRDKLDKTFQYAIPEEMLSEVVPGVAVEVPFGNNRTINGFVIEVTDEPVFDVDKTKPINRVLRDKNSIESRLIELAAWMKYSFGGTLNQSLKTVMPVKQVMKQKEKKAVRLKASKQEVAELLKEAVRKKYRAKERLLNALSEDEYIDYSLLTSKLNITGQTIKAFEQKGILAIESTEYYRNPVKQVDNAGSTFEYNDEQNNAINTFAADYRAGEFGTYLLYGVTGSGKTEVYIEMIKAVLESNRQVIMLIPEIALTYQTVTRFYRVFKDRVSIINSRLSAGERYDQFQRARNGEIDIIIGPRSALFTPFKDVGLIIIDEEHDGAYKSETVPKYHARMVAQKLAEMSNASLVLGSATPSIDSFYRTETGEYKLLTMKERAKGNPLPKVYIEDLRDEFAKGNKSILSVHLQELIADRLEKKQQIMLFLNKRGYSSFISCRKCGTVIKCPHCDISLTNHTIGRSRGKLVCHFCGYETAMVTSCPECGGKYISAFKVGTQQIEEIVHEMFPSARILRMDADTTAGKDGHEKILSEFAENKADVLIGTQMIVKGHDFPDVTLVGILAADMSLYASDYLATENTFQLLTQAAGRAGRGDEPGEVVIQTYTPDNYSIVASANQDYDTFYQEEIARRLLSKYPPVNNLLVCRFSSADEALLERATEKIRPERDGIQVIGPVNAPIYKTNDTYHKIIYFKSKNYASLAGLGQELENYVMNNVTFKKVSLQLDFNPMQIM